MTTGRESVYTGKSPSSSNFRKKTSINFSRLFGHEL